MLWLGMHFPELPLEVFTLRESGCAGDVSGAPRVVIEDNRIVLCDAAARAAGIAPGTTLALAHSIVQGLSPSDRGDRQAAGSLRHYRRDPGAEQRRLHRLAELIYRFSSQVSPVPPDGVVAEIGASLRLFGGATALTHAAVALCQDLGHQVACASAGTPLAALSLARAGTAELADASLRLVAIEPEHISPAVLEQLANMGVHTLGQLLKLPAAGLAERFGQGLVGYLQRLVGTRPDPRHCLQPSARFRRDLHLLSPLRNKATLLAGPMTQLLTELQHWLVAHQLGTAQLRWQFSDAGRGTPPVVLTVRFSTAQQRQQRFLDISRLELERAALPEEVIALGLRAERLQPWQTGSHGLFRYLPPASPAGVQPAGVQPAGAQPAGQRSRSSGGAGVRAAATSDRTEPASRLTAGQLAELGELVDRLEARLGRGACWSLEALDQHLPESAWRPVPPLRDSAGVVHARRRTPDRAAGRAMRPVWLFEPPRPIEARHLTLLRGPERIEAGWWHSDPAGTISRSRRDAGQTAIGRSLPRSDDQPPDHQPRQAAWRDYYVARLGTGAECWVFVDAGSQWYLHGYFG